MNQNECMKIINTLSVKFSKPMALTTSSKEFTVGLFVVPNGEFVARYLEKGEDNDLMSAGIFSSVLVIVFCTKT